MGWSYQNNLTGRRQETVAATATAIATARAEAISQGWHLQGVGREQSGLPRHSGKQADKFPGTMTPALALNTGVMHVNAHFALK
jgi:hypothetical protein